MTAIRKPARGRWLLLLALLASLGVAFYFGARAYQRASYWKEHRDEPLHAWMSVRYISHSYHIPPHVLLRAVNMPPLELDRRPLGVIAKLQNRTSDEVIADMENGIAKFRLAHPVPGGGPP